MALLCGPAGAFLGLAALVAIRTVRDMPRLGVFWMAVTVFIGAFAMSEAIEDFSTAEQFRHDGDSTVAKVIASHPDDHNTLTVGFTVAGTLVETKIAAPGGASDFEPGDRLVVYYDRTFPMRAAAIWPQWDLVTAVTGFLVPVVVLPVVGIAIAGLWFSPRPGASSVD